MSTCNSIESRAPYFHIGDEIYRKMASELLDMIGARKCIFDVSIDFEDKKGNSYLFTDSSIWAYRMTEQYPEGTMEVIDDLGSGWCEFHSYTPEGDEKTNDFQFNKLKEYI